VKVSSKNQHAAIDELRAMLKPGDTIYTRLNHVSKSGMMRVIDLFVIRDNEPRRITWSACQATGTTYNDKHEGMRMDGCGMDMGFAAVYNLGSVLWPNGTPEPHGTRNGEPDTCGGYALKHRWL
jgi:hypothetical protein